MKQRIPLIKSLFLSVLLACQTPTLNQSLLARWEVTTVNFGIPSGYPIRSTHSIGSPYGMRIHPITGKSTMHKGQDIPCRKGTRIFAVASGEVTISEKSTTRGNFIEIAHFGKETVHTRYLHLHRRHVGVGTTVRKGELIGTCGSTGRSTGPHLHFEVLHNQKAIPPLQLKQAVEREWDVLYGY